MRPEHVIFEASKGASVLERLSALEAFVGENVFAKLANQEADLAQMREMVGNTVLEKLAKQEADLTQMRERVEVLAAGSTKGAVYNGPEEDAPQRKELSEEDISRSRAVSISMDEQQGMDDNTAEANVVWDCGDNLHAWCVVHATKRAAGPCMAMSFMIFSLAFVLLQSFLLASVILESSFARCTLHDHCQLGEWCSPALAGVFSTEPGVCFDCWSAKMFYKARFLNASYEISPDPYELMAAAAGDQWLLDGSLHCNATDTRPRRCDFLVNNLENMTPLSMLIFVVMAVLIVASLVDEMDQIEHCEQLSWYRAIIRDKSRYKYIIMAMSWLTCTLRRWILPMMTVGATLGLVLREPLSASNLLLNGLSITFVTSLDDTIVTLLNFPMQKAEALPDSQIYLLTWLFHRLYAIFIFAAFVGTVYAAEEMLIGYGNEAKYGAVCSDIREIVTVFSFYVSVGFALVHAALRSFLWSRSHQVKYSQMNMTGFQSSNVDADASCSWFCVLAKFLLDLLVPPFLAWYFRDAFVAQGPLVKLQIGDGIWTRLHGSSVG